MGRARRRPVGRAGLPRRVVEGRAGLLQGPEAGASVQKSDPLPPADVQLPAKDSGHFQRGRQAVSQWDSPHVARVHVIPAVGLSHR